MQYKIISSIVSSSPKVIPIGMGKTIRQDRIDLERIKSYISRDEASSEPDSTFPIPKEELSYSIGLDMATTPGIKALKENWEINSARLYSRIFDILNHRKIESPKTVEKGIRRTSIENLFAIPNSIVFWEPLMDITRRESVEFSPDAIKLINHLAANGRIPVSQADKLISTIENLPQYRYQSPPLGFEKIFESPTKYDSLALLLLLRQTTQGMETMKHYYLHEDADHRAWNAILQFGVYTKIFLDDLSTILSKERLLGVQDHSPLSIIFNDSYRDVARTLRELHSLSKGLVYKHYEDELLKLKRSLIRHQLLPKDWDALS